uniref:Uncharacterized protein n=2 Tax=Viruses TaxID=10239 RepID=A0A8S5PK32_9CAUD|nr:MAG TPA: hypothetical protein [Myoviridae sp. ct0jJ30]DAE31793.1 MAG TPA: hypothetical protein [virus sp. ctBM815]
MYEIHNAVEPTGLPACIVPSSLSVAFISRTSMSLID